MGGNLSLNAGQNITIKSSLTQAGGYIYILPNKATNKSQLDAQSNPLELKNANRQIFWYLSKRAIHRIKNKLLKPIKKIELSITYWLKDAT